MVHWITVAAARQRRNRTRRRRRRRLCRRARRPPAPGAPRPARQPRTPLSPAPFFQLLSQGCAAEARTYNTIISACAKAGQPGAALGVYERMLADGVAPTGTTYTSLISAFGKAGQAEEALRVYRDMQARGCERNVITCAGRWLVVFEVWGCGWEGGAAGSGLRPPQHVAAAGAASWGAGWAGLPPGLPAASLPLQPTAAFLAFFSLPLPPLCSFSSLISACERAGRCDLALQLWGEMRAEGCRPNVVTFNALLGACAHGAAGGLARGPRALSRQPPACCCCWAAGGLVAWGAPRQENQAHQLTAYSRPSPAPASPLPCSRHVGQGGRDL